MFFVTSHRAAEIVVFLLYHLESTTWRNLLGRLALAALVFSRVFLAINAGFHISTNKTSVQNKKQLGEFHRYQLLSFTRVPGCCDLAVTPFCCWR